VYMCIQIVLRSTDYCFRKTLPVNYTSNIENIKFVSSMICQRGKHCMRWRCTKFV